MAEKTFEKGLIKKLSMNHFFVRKMAVLSAPGFPDLYIERNENQILLELKEFEKDKKVKDYFTDMQIPFYIDYIDKGGKRLFVIFKEGNKYYLYDVFTIVRFKDLKYSVIRNKCIEILNNYTDIVESLKWKCEKTYVKMIDRRC